MHDHQLMPRGTDGYSHRYMTSREGSSRSKVIMKLSSEMQCVIARRTLVSSTSIGQSPRNISTNRNKPSSKTTRHKPSSKTTRHGISSEQLNKGGFHAAHQPVIGPGERRKAEEVYEKPRTCEHLRAKTAPQQTTEYPWSMTCSGTRTSYRKFQKKENNRDTESQV